MIGYKRKARSSSRFSRGRAAGIRFSRVQPWASYGAARVPRGSTFSLNTFGRTYRTASAMQKHNRKFHGFTGRGRYLWNRPNFRRAFTQASHLGADLLSSTIAPMLPAAGPLGVAAAADLEAGVNAYDKLNHRPYRYPFTMSPRQFAARLKPDWRR